MRADLRFQNQSKSLWANVRSISQEVGYTVRGRGIVKIPSLEEMCRAMTGIGLSSTHLMDDGAPTALATRLRDYFETRATLLNEFVEPRLMMADQAGPIFEELQERLDPSFPLPSNKQSGEKAGPALFTGIINMLIEAHVDGCPVDYDPRKLTTVTRDGVPLRTLSRRVDGAMPGHVDPIAIWEIKEYYHTTTFGSRVADGVYETLLDGMELQEAAHREGTDVEHILMVDAKYTWWDCGKSYLCRIIDMLHMGYVDEVLFGREVVERIPPLAASWAAAYRDRDSRAAQ